MPFLRIALSIVILAGSSHWVAAAELTARDLASPDMALMVEVNRPLQLIDNPLARDLWALLQQTHAVQTAAKSPDFDKFRHAGRFIEKSLGVDWQAAVTKLTAGGIVIVIQPSKQQAEPDVTVVVTAADSSILAQLIAAVDAEIRRGAGARNGAGPEAVPYRAHQMHRVGNGMYAVAGRQLVVSNTKPGLEATLDCLAGASANEPFDLPQSLRLVDRRGNSPAILATVNLGLLRQDPKLREALKLPADDPGPQLLLGGYLDLLRRAEFASAGLFVDGPPYELRARVPAGSVGAAPALRGFFATAIGDSAPLLLSPPGAIFSAAWFRDYRKLWDARSELLNSDLVRQLDAADSGAREQPLQIGISDLLQWFGPHWRVVAARQREQVYPRNIEKRLPAVGLAVSVRDETAVRDRLLAPVDGLILFGLNKLIEDFKKVDYRDARITTFRFSELAAGSDPNKAFLFHLNPAFALSHGHLILGSTAEIVRDLIDDLDRLKSLATESGSQTERVTDRQQLFLGEAAEFLKDFQDQIVRDAVRKQDIETEVAEQDARLFYKILERIGRIATSHVIAGDHFEFTVTVGQ
jgi:hypothetical protein